MEKDFFRVCSTCRTPIAFGAKYWVCSVSTCNRGPVALYFCSVPCWDAHVPDAKHRDAWAEEAIAPNGANVETKRESGSEERRRVVSVAVQSAPRNASREPDIEASDEVLVVVSKLKGFVKAQSGLSTSDGVFPVLSDHLRKLSVLALRSAAGVGRKTVLARDFEAVLRGETAKD